MSIRLKPLKDQVIVITGASSGIGLATAKLAAERGAKVVLAARDADALAEIERDINSSGGTALSVPTDVSQRDQVEALAQATIARFGGFDTWVNNAGLSIFGKLEEIDDADNRQMFDINFWGLVSGSLVAVKHLKPKGGAIINLGSVGSDMVLPLQSMYAVTKHAIKGFTDGLRIELEADDAPISVTLIKPSAINTPFAEHAKNYTGHATKLPPPAYPVSEVAESILYACENVERDIFVGGAGRVMSTMNKQMPGVMDWLGRNVIMPQQLQDSPPEQTEGSLYAPRANGRAEGNHPGYVRELSFYGRAQRHTSPVGVALAALVGLVAVAVLASDEPGAKARK